MELFLVRKEADDSPAQIIFPYTLAGGVDVLIVLPANKAKKPKKELIIY